MTGVEAEERARELDVAVVGMACRFPGADDVDAFWANLCAGVDSITHFPAEAEAAADDGGTRPGRLVRAGGIVDAFEYFDAEFFGYAPAEAQRLDPQQRTFLEVAWHALESAGHAPSSFEGTIGVYAGQSVSTRLLLDRVDPVADGLGAFELVAANDKDFLSMRTSYKLGLTGPSLTVQTACSTSLTAIHLATRALLGFECDLALAGGASYTPLRREGYLYEQGGVVSPDGRCRAFDRDAAGFVPADGIGVVALRRLEDALRDGDEVHAVIRGSAVGNDGRAKAGFTAPSVDGQSAVVADALAIAGVDPATVELIEAHGAGTPLGDPIEVAALAAVYDGPLDGGTCALGSVKTNIGHTDAAAGVAGFIKAVLALSRETIPPTLHFAEPNPAIDFAATRFVVATELRPWVRGARPRRAAVNSLGIGGTNAHVILEDAPTRGPSADDPRPHVVAVSATTDAAAREAAAALADRLERSDSPLSDVAYTLQVGRTHLRRRIAVAATDRDSAVQALRALADAESAETGGGTAFMFSGGGSQYPGMAAELYAREPTFRDAFERALAAYQDARLAEDVRAAVTARRNDHVTADALEQPTLALPAIFAVEVALVELLRQLGVEPTASIGHSLGEYTAAWTAGVLTLEDATTVVKARARLLDTLAPGEMVIVSAPEAELEEALDGRLSIAAVNSPRSAVVSGSVGEIRGFVDLAAERGWNPRRLPIAVAAHSSLADPILDDFRRALSGVRLRPAQLPFVSNLTGEWARDDDVTSIEYWVRHLRGTVRFAAGVESLLRSRNDAVLEIGPGSTLATLAREAVPAARVAHVLPHPRDARGDDLVFRSALAFAWEAGAPVEWKRLHVEPRRRVELPAYRFRRIRHEPETSRPRERSSRDGHAPGGPSFFLPSWRRLPRSQADAPQVPLLAMAGADPFSRRVVAALRARHPRTEVHEGPLGADALEAALDRLGAVGGVRIVHMLALGERDELVASPRGPAGLSAIARLATDAKIEGLELVVLTRAAFHVTSSEVLRPQQAAMLGPVRTIPLEVPSVRTRLVDVDDDGPALSVVHVVRAVVGDWPQVVAVRGADLWTETLEPFRPQRADAPPIRHGGTYLVTGGTGGLGSLVARFLADSHAARVVAVSRRAVETPLLDDPGTVSVRRADTTRPDELGGLVARVLDRYGRIDGVVHAATTPGGGMSALLSAEAFRDAAAAKATGARILVDALHDVGAEPHFVAFFSSTTALTGGVGVAAYTSANAILDSYAHVASEHFPTLSIQWERWRGVGLAADVERRHRELTGADLPGGLAPQDALAAFETALAHVAEIQLTVASAPPEAGGAVQPALNEGAEKRPPTSAEDAAPRHARPPVTAAYAAPADAGERRMAELWEAMLGIENVGRDDDFFELGGDSLAGIRLVNRANDAFDAALRIADLFENPTVATLARAAVASSAAAPAPPIPRRAPTPVPEESNA